jgi:hypothetical protein
MAAALLCAALPGAAAAQSDASAGVVTTVNGDATLIRAVAAARPVSLHMRDEIFMRDRIHTQPRSLVRVLLGGKALITVRELSVLAVIEEAGRVTVDLQSGKIGVAVVKSRMRPGEVIEIRSPNATAAVRGTVFVVEVDPVPAAPAADGPPATTTRVHLFHGALDVSARLAATRPTVRLAELQSVVVAGNTLGAVRPIPRDAVAALTADLKPRQVQTPDVPSEFTGGLLAQEQGRAVQLASTLLGPVPGAPIRGALKSVKTTVGTVTDVAGTTAATLERLMDSLGLGDGTSGPLASVDKTVDALGNTVGGAVDAVESALGNTTDGLGNTLGRPGGGAPAAVGQITSPAGSTAPPIVMSAAPPITNPVVPPIVNPLTPIVNPIVNPITNLLGGKK